MKQNVEAEGGELILRNAEGHIAIIPKHRRGEAEAYLEADDQHSLGGLINSLPRAEDYAEDGSLYIGIPPDGNDSKVGLNAENGLTIPSGGAIAGVGATAGISTSEDEIPEFENSSKTEIVKNAIKVMFKDKLYSKDASGKTVAQNRLGANMEPEGYGAMWSRAYNAVIANKTDPVRKEIDETPAREPGKYIDPDVEHNMLRSDIINIYNNKPTKHGLITKSNSRPLLSKDPNADYYSINDPIYEKGLISDVDNMKASIDENKQILHSLNIPKDKLDVFGEDLFNVNFGESRDLGEGFFNKLESKVNRVLGIDKERTADEIKESRTRLKSHFSNDTEEQFNEKITKLANYNIKTGGIRPESSGNIMQNHFVTPGKDARGNYISYYDKWDINPASNLEKKDIKTDFGKPVELYDRIYYKDYNGTRKKMYMTDDELYNSDLKKGSVYNKKLNIADLQKELVNRGFKLPKSTYEDDRPDDFKQYDPESAFYNVKGELNDETIQALEKWKKTQPARSKSKDISSKRVSRIDDLE